MSFSVIIPAQEKNYYHSSGDLAPFGDMTLLEWKVTQCKDFCKSDSIYISSDSKIIEKIAKKLGVNFIRRKKNISYQEAVTSTIEMVKSKDIIWAQPTSPFINSDIYLKMYHFYKEKNLDSLVSVEKKREYVFFKNRKLNFEDTFISRRDIEPIFIMTNGCYIIKKDIALECKSLVSNEPSLFEVDSFVATEIKDLSDYTIAREMISLYFRREIDV